MTRFWILALFAFLPLASFSAQARHHKQHAKTEICCHDHGGVCTPDDGCCDDCDCCDHCGSDCDGSCCDHCGCGSCDDGCCPGDGCDDGCCPDDGCDDGCCPGTGS